jgi:hypothetical protein
MGNGYNRGEPAPQKKGVKNGQILAPEVPIPAIPATHPGEFRPPVLIHSGHPPEETWEWRWLNRNPLPYLPEIFQEVKMAKERLSMRKC